MIRFIRNLAKAGISVYRAARSELNSHLAVYFDRPGEESQLSIQLKGEYLITTSEGVFKLSSGKIRRVSRLPAFGIAISGDRTVYLATWDSMRTKVVAAGLDDLLSPRPRSWREIWRLPVASSAARLHQISVCGDSLWLANTAENCLTRLDRHTGQWKASIVPFKCSFGHPIQSDHNHINAVLATSRYIVFSAFKINRQSCIGLLGDGKIWLFSYRNLGVHDCVFDGDNFLFSDSYSFWDEKINGLIIRNGQDFENDFFLETAAGFVRGIAGEHGEILVGNSVSGSRDKRFKGTGDIIVLRSDGKHQSFKIPAPQIYDIIRLNGDHFSSPPPDCSATKLAQKFTQWLGDPVDVFKIGEAMSGEHVNKFDNPSTNAMSEYFTDDQE